MLMSPYADEVAKVIVEEGVKVVTTGAGNPEKYMEMWKAAGIKVIPVVASVALAKRMERYGADAVVAEGTESGGHIGEATTMTLVPQVVDAVSIPVIAAGGIGDGRGIAAAFMLGAEAVQMGTRFLVAKECTVHQNYKDRVLKAKDIDSTVTGRTHGHPVRCLRNQMTREYVKLENEGKSFEELEYLTLGGLRKAVMDGDVTDGVVMAGQIVMEKAREAGVRVLPVDSEHNAIFQCLNGNHGGPEAVSRLILTASGGPFRTWKKEDLEHVTLEQALKHPTWTMGRKITIDSATLFNKGLEMIEARWLFDVPMNKVDVIVHPQSIVHSMVEYMDGTVLAQMSSSDMCFPIQYAVTWPDRVPNSLKQLNFAEIGQLVFEAPRPDAFPALNLARRAGECCGTMPAVYNAANEVAVDAFIRGDLRFTGIWKLVEAVMNDHVNTDPRGNLDSILEADAWARSHAAALIPSIH